MIEFNPNPLTEYLTQRLSERLERIMDEATVKGGIKLTPEEAERMEHAMHCNCSHCGHGRDNRFG